MNPTLRTPHACPLEIEPGRAGRIGLLGLVAQQLSDALGDLLDQFGRERDRDRLAHPTLPSVLFNRALEESESSRILSPLARGAWLVSARGRAVGTKAFLQEGSYAHCRHRTGPLGR